MPTPNDFTNYQFPVNRNTAGGDFSPTAAAPPVNEVPSGAYPSGGYDPLNGQFSTRPEFATEEPSIPKILHESTRASVEAHARLNAVYGLCQPVATLGSHPWLRDEMTEPSEEEPGNAAPDGQIGVPFEASENSEEVGNFSWGNSASRGEK